MSMNNLTGFQRDLLYVIAGQETPYGTALKNKLEEYYGKKVHHGRLYSNLDTLVHKGLVKKEAMDRRRNLYTLTARGWRELKDRREWEDQFMNERTLPEDN